MKTLPVSKAVRRNADALKRDGNATRMLLRQENFPYQCPDNEDIASADSNGLDQTHLLLCSDEHNVPSGAQFIEWLDKADVEDVLAFITALLEVPQPHLWIGFRVLVTKDMQGENNYNLQIFKPAPNSCTKLYNTNSPPPGLVDSIAKLAK